MASQKKPAAGGHGIMRWLADRPLAQKFVICIGLMAAVAAALTVVGQTRMGSIAAKGVQQNDEATIPLQKLDQVNLDIASVRAKLASTAAIDFYADGKDKWMNGLTEALTTAMNDVDAYEGFATSEENWKAIDDALQVYVNTTNDKITPLVQSGDTDGISTEIMGEVQGFAAALMTAVTNESQALADKSATLNAQSETAYHQATTIMWVVFAVALIVVVSICVVIVKQVVRTSNDVLTAIKAVAQGNLTVVPPVRSSDELGTIAALLLDISFGLKAEADTVINAVDAVLKAGFRTRDIADASTPASAVLGTEAMGAEVLKFI